jgi:hypothetical protein
MTTLVLVTLNSPLGANVGPIINLTANVGTVVPNVASTTQLLAGLIVEVDVLATEITMTSEGVCETALMLPIPTPTTTTTTTAMLPCKCYTMENLETLDGVVPYKIDYLDCNSVFQFLFIPKQTSANVCALENTIVPNFMNNITDNGLCTLGCTTTTTTIPL